MNRNLIGKIQMKGKIKCLTGLHIGAAKENIEIGAIDASVVRDPVTREPYIPGSSLKGKLRALLEKSLSIKLGIIGTENRINIGTKTNPVYIHVCTDADKAYKCPICRIFGSTGQGGGKNYPSRLIVRDAYLTTESVEELSQIDTGLQFTEWKFENAIDRVTSAANPRQLERVPRGAEFEFEFIYNVEDKETVLEDLESITLAIELLKLDSLGGHGSRGYGKIQINFEDIKCFSLEYLKSGQGEVKSITDLSKKEELLSVFK
ncbi:type III-A CRISPR-associated RAMP protein Csm3 [Thermodesulfovibrio yellowstonii]|uniref:CRISPR system Cms endoribonuclease Csm3 n=2 Tax=Thermodesulfovibrio yellowstonii TaxID=28262 RepID=B5YH94_THEYD|nr:MULTISPECIES: type III-A CRISPR-associated RAMP protein Csm3 [Thermodesulfovibrio]ACI20619.1 CRISPR-associated RAMP protein, Csm3 family [Thermodesulfovibrio yellowstonii DSM 11347]GLI52596.1 type III-A CRISPR-associated RAMP protein Csm3 [Thermodesulfovibrio islandicus]